MFENLFGNLRKKFQDHLDRKEQERLEMDKMQREIDFEKKRIFQEEFKKNALEVVRGQAKKDAAKKSGLQKLRAQNRLRRLNEPDAINPGNYLSQFSEYTQRNLAKREENMKRTDAMREDAKKILSERKRGAVQNNPIRKPFSGTGFGNRQNG